ncbi:hypothetical protein SprV_0401630300 [Sparganum proliferum]
MYYLVDEDKITSLPPVTQREEIEWSLFLLLVICPSVYFIVWSLIGRLRSKVPSKTSDKQRKFRFRNRDKVRYHAIRLSRKFGAMTARLNELTSREEKQKVIIDFVKSNLPESFFQPEPDNETCNMPEDLRLMFCRVRMLNYLGRKVIVGLAEFIKTVELDTGQYLFNTGDLENNIFVVKSGQVDLILMDPDGNEVVVHEVTAGGNPYTVMAVIDCMIKEPKTYQSVKAIAATNSTVICLPIPDLLKVCQQNPPAMLRLGQMICVCIQRVTFAALHNFFGLDKELFNQTPPPELPDSAVAALLAGREDAASLTEAFPSTAKQTCPVLKRGSDALTSTARQLARGSLTPLNLYGATTVAGSPHDLTEPSSDVDAETASLDEVSAPIGLDSTSGRVIPGSQPADLLELGEVLPPATTPGSSVPREPTTENCGVSGTERRLVITRSYCKTQSHLPSDASISNDSEVEVDEDSALGAEDDMPAAAAAVAATTTTQKEMEDPLLRAAEDDLARLLGLPDASLIHGLVSIVSVNRGDVLSKELELQAELYYVLTGELQVLQTTVASSHDVSPPKTVTCLVCRQGELVGLLGVITGEPNNGSIHATCPTLLAVLPRENFFLLIRACPDVLINAAALVTRRLSALCRLSDFALEWHSVDAGKALYKQGDASSYMYVVLNGRFREVHAHPDGSKQVICEMGRGAFIGFVEVSGAKPRVSTVMALRDSEVVRIPSILLHWLRRLTPHPVSRFIQILSDRLIGSLQSYSPASPSSSFTVTAEPFQSPLTYMLGSQSVVNIAGAGPFNSSHQQQQQQSTDASIDSVRITGGAMANLRAIAIIPSSPKINAEAFCLELQHAISVFGSSVRLTSEIINRRVGSNALEPVNEYRLSSWLNHQEDLHRMIFYVGDSQQGITPWTRRCLHQADCVMVLALAADDPTRPSVIEEIVSKDSSKVTKLLVLMHTLETDYPPVKRTAAWLNARPWVNQHYHIRCPPRVLSKRSSHNLVVFYSRVFSCEAPNPHSDMSRLARYLTGQAVGLVLGGGGAKGGAHVGVIRAFQEAGIPIDMIGGTSIGAFVGALWAEETRVAQCSQRARDFALVFKSVWPKVRDLTYPTVSLFSGHEFNLHIETIFKDRQIEDLWIPYFCITTDISNCKMRIHTNGSLWRYVRASMSLSGYMPPLCDPYDGSYLLDGGYVNNVPADVMATFGARTIYAVDVGSVYDTNLTNYGDWLSGWWLIYQRLFRWRGPPIRVPNLSEIQSRLAYISCIRQLEEVKRSGICHYLRPPIDKYMTLQFSAFEEIVALGYIYGKGVLDSWHSNGLLEKMMPGVYRPEVFRSSHSKALTYARDKEAHSDAEQSEAPALRHRYLSLSELAVPLGRLPEVITPTTEPEETGLLNVYDKMHSDRVSSLELGSSAILPAARESSHPLPEHWLYASHNWQDAATERPSESVATTSVADILPNSKPVSATTKPLTTLAATGPGLRTLPTSKQTTNLPSTTLPMAANLPLTSAKSELLDSPINAKQRGSGVDHLLTAGASDSKHRLLQLQRETTDAGGASRMAPTQFPKSDTAPLEDGYEEDIEDEEDEEEAEVSSYFLNDEDDLLEDFQQMTLSDPELSRHRLLDDTNDITADGGGGNSVARTRYPGSLRRSFRSRGASVDFVYPFNPPTESAAHSVQTNEVGRGDLRRPPSVRYRPAATAVDSPVAAPQRPLPSAIAPPENHPLESPLRHHKLRRRRSLNRLHQAAVSPMMTIAGERLTPPF